MSDLSALRILFSVQFVRVCVTKTEGVYAILTKPKKKFQRIQEKYLRIK